MFPNKSGFPKKLNRNIALSLIVPIMLLAPVTFTKKDIYPPSSPSLVIAINEATYTLANQHDQFYSFIGVRALAMTHLAIHDIYNNSNKQYAAFLVKSHPSQPIHLEMAIIASTKHILNSIYPDRQDTINDLYQEWQQQLTHMEHKEASIDYGKLVAQKYIDYRAHDGHEKNGDYTPMTKPGDYQYTPGFDYVWKPDFSVARPFTLDSVSQFRSPPPPDLASQTYAESYNEVKDYGVKNSTYRNADQTSFGHWWAEFGEHAWNRIGRIVAKQRKLSEVETNRMFALINMNLYDLYLASFDSKYFYDTWRPYTAIHHGAQDGNPLTQGDIDWEPEMVTPPWPEYPSAHAAVGAAGAEIITNVLGTAQVDFSMQSTTALTTEPMRTYHSLDKAADDCADSRIMNGYHFRFATEEGKKQGRKIARHTIDHFLIPLP